LSTYGPADEKTILDWIAQGRLDDTCFVKSIASDQWLSVGAWRDETKANIEKRATALFSDPAISSNGYASEVRQSYTFGSAPVAANQTIALPTSGKALASLILGISGWLVCFTGLGGPICAIIAIVLGRNDLSRMRRGEIDSKDRWMATTGFWLGAVELIVVALAVIGFLIAIILDK